MPGAKADSSAPRVNTADSTMRVTLRPMRSTTGPAPIDPTIAPSSSEETTTSCMPSDNPNSGAM
ncbi:hypothetical protein GCM10023108_29570 [Saccharopolyspora hordei]